MPARPTGVAPPAPGKTVGKGGAVMISVDELERIKNQVQKTNEDPYTTFRNEERKTLQQLSKSRIQNWPNTLEALRLKREEDRIKRLEEEEVSESPARAATPLPPCLCYRCADREEEGRRQGASLLGRTAPGPDREG